MTIVMLPIRSAPSTNIPTNFISRQTLHYYPETFGGKPPASVAARKEIHVELPGNDNRAVEARIRNWIEAIAGKAQVIAPTRLGQEAAISGHMPRSR
jgi:hypothetical protein